MVGLADSMSMKREEHIDKIFAGHLWAAGARVIAAIYDSMHVSQDLKAEIGVRAIVIWHETVAALIFEEGLFDYLMDQDDSDFNAYPAACFRIACKLRNDKEFIDLNNRRLVRGNAYSYENITTAETMLWQIFGGDLYLQEIVDRNMHEIEEDSICWSTLSCKMTYFDIMLTTSITLQDTQKGFQCSENWEKYLTVTNVLLLQKNLTQDAANADAAKSEPSVAM